MKYILLFLLLVSVTTCDNNSSEVVILSNQTGILYWGGSPAVDGSGILFRTDGTDYGAPGNKEDYSEYLSSDDNEVLVVADIRINGEETVRGWGATYPAIEFLNIRVIED